MFFTPYGEAAPLGIFFPTRAWSVRYCADAGPPLPLLESTFKMLWLPLRIFDLRSGKPLWSVKQQLFLQRLELGWKREGRLRAKVHKPVLCRMKCLRLSVKPLMLSAEEALFNC